MQTEKHYTTVLCRKCHATLVSKHRHDFVMCDCDNQAFADGGCDYARVGAKNLYDILVWDYAKSDWRKCGYLGDNK
jgi:hypothetical protein